MKRKERTSMDRQLQIIVNRLRATHFHKKISVTFEKTEIKSSIKKSFCQGKEGRYFYGFFDHKKEVNILSKTEWGF